MPMWADFKAHFFIDGSRMLHLNRIEIEHRWRRQSAYGDLDFDKWPEHDLSGQVAHAVPRMRELFSQERAVGG
ncbi:MAG: hypothetical protein QM736_14465 [Vicinamibacterales bacterium]